MFVGLARAGWSFCYVQGVACLGHLAAVVLGALQGLVAHEAAGFAGEALNVRDRTALWRCSPTRTAADMQHDCPCAASKRA